MTSKTEWLAIEAATRDAYPAVDFTEFTAGAWENADCTVYLEKAAQESEIFDIALGSLSGLLADSKNTEAHDFFTALGVKF
ncbi:MAG: hypothetical protein E4H01_10740 [Lysobacterales bacterium]|nr:MAG: hypothetical protein E4H01_10740 [Xanthomonadales bacterium]